MLQALLVSAMRFVLPAIVSYPLSAMQAESPGTIPCFSQNFLEK